MPKSKSEIEATSTKDITLRLNDGARQLAQRLGHRLMGTEHLLYALSRMPAKTFPDVTKLHQAHLKPEQVRAEIVKLLGEGVTTAGSQPGVHRSLQGVYDTLAKMGTISSDSLALFYFRALLAVSQEDSQGNTYAIIRNLTGKTPAKLSELFI